VRYRLFMLRHGTSTGNQQAIRQGRLDFLLSDEGERQIRHLADYWKAQGIPFDEIIASPLKRACRSAELIAQILGLTYIEDPLWIERDAGQVQGASVDEGREYYADRRLPHAYEPLFGDGETLMDLHLRAATALRSVLARPAGTYLIVAHGGILAAAVRIAIGLLPTAWNAPVDIRFDNAGYAELTLDDKYQSWSLVHVNACAPS
jgi:2,3-bisphosphoglycerate-dependent phosphoglycerate mutase